MTMSSFPLIVLEFSFSIRIKMNSDPDRLLQFFSLLAFAPSRCACGLFGCILFMFTCIIKVFINSSFRRAAKESVKKPIDNRVTWEPMSADTNFPSTDYLIFNARSLSPHSPFYALSRHTCEPRPFAPRDRFYR